MDVRNRTTGAFTLIELLIVVGIIAILAAIAVPNLLEAQTRAKVSATKNNMRVLATGLEAYAVDSGRYPPSSGVGAYYFPLFTFADPVSVRLIPLTTPVSYISAVPKDVFRPREAWGASSVQAYDGYDYVDADQTLNRGCGLTSGAAWRIASAGPDLYLAYGGRVAADVACNERGVDYDPTNGTTSNGDLVGVGPPSKIGGDPQDATNGSRPGVLRVPAYRQQW